MNNTQLGEGNEKKQQQQQQQIEDHKTDHYGFQL